MGSFFYVVIVEQCLRLCRVMQDNISFPYFLFIFIACVLRLAHDVLLNLIGAEMACFVL